MGSLADAIRVTGRYMHLESGGITTLLDEDEHEVAIRHILVTSSHYGSSQFIESTIMLSTCIARLILGEGWSPLRVEFQHHAPSDDRIQRRLFRCPLQYGAERSAVVVHQDDLTRRTRNGNAHMLAFLERHLDSEQRLSPLDFVAQVDQLIAANLATGGATIDQTAKDLCISRRTLQRRLEDENTSFSRRLDAARRRIVEDYFQTERRPSLNALALRLGYSDPSAASRYMRTQLDLSARELARKSRER